MAKVAYCSEERYPEPGAVAQHAKEACAGRVALEEQRTVVGEGHVEAHEYMAPLRIVPVHLQSLLHTKLQARDGLARHVCAFAAVLNVGTDAAVLPVDLVVGDLALGVALGCCFPLALCVVCVCLKGCMHAARGNQIKTKLEEMSA